MQETDAGKKHLAVKEKNTAALNSILAAILLTALKLVVGIATNSLGILSEALHSALDLMAASVTYFAVRYSSSPPDPGHPYGHGKMENLSALIESLLLLVTCFWIIREATERLFLENPPVTLSLWALGVMIISIIVDISRSRMLMRIAKKHNSQALEADALHFSTDILSSCVVIIGLGCLYLATVFPQESMLRFYLEKGDALAALGVSIIIIKVSYSLARRAVNVLLDAGDAGISTKLEVILEKIHGVHGIRSLRLRESGPDFFIDVAIYVDNALTVADSKILRAAIVESLQTEKPGASVTIEIIPVEEEKQNIVTQLRSIAASYALYPHAIELFELYDDKIEKEMNIPETAQQQVELHLEMPPQTTLEAAHLHVSSFENKVHEAFPNLSIITHMEPEREKGQAILLQPGTQLRDKINEIITTSPDLHDCHNITGRIYRNEIFIALHCRMAPETTIEKSHNSATRLQKDLHHHLPEIKKVTVHMEPTKNNV